MCISTRVKIYHSCQLILVEFILQADFVLIANREEIESDSAWNKALLHLVTHALRMHFLKSPPPYLDVPQVMRHSNPLVRMSRRSGIS
jgi:hypothetical protein